MTFQSLGPEVYASLPSKLHVEGVNLTAQGWGSKSHFHKSRENVARLVRCLNPVVSRQDFVEAMKYVQL